MIRTSIRFGVLAMILIAIPATCWSRPTKGFHTGPYLLLEGGVLQMDYDTDQASGQRIGRDFEPTFGFLFGWNLLDEFSTELQGRYATDANSGRRLHVANANVYGKWTLITDALTDFPTFRVLPFLKGGLAIRVTVMPGNPNATGNTVTQIGWGPSPGGGIAFLWKKYFYFGIDVQGDILFFDNTTQTVNDVPNTLVYMGGFHPSFSGMAMVGVHY